MSEWDDLPGHAFISYVREDAAEVDRLQRELESAGVQVWRDTTRLWPGEDWRGKIRQAITGNSLAFIACFSHNSVRRRVSYHNEELTLAIDQMRLRPPDVPWLIPVRFSACDIPDRDIGAGRTLGALHCADLFGDHLEEDVARVVTTVLRLLHQGEQSWERAYQEALNGDGDLFLQGVSLYTTVTEANHALKRRLQLGCTVRVLLIRPGSPAARLAADRLGDPSGGELLRVRTEASLALLTRLRGVAPDRLQVRLADQDLSFSAAVIRPGTRQATMYVEYYAYKRPQDGMRLVLRAYDDLPRYNNHLNQIDELWHRAVPWIPGGP